MLIVPGGVTSQKLLRQTERTKRLTQHPKLNTVLYVI